MNITRTRDIAPGRLRWGTGAGRCLWLFGRSISTVSVLVVAIHGMGGCVPSSPSAVKGLTAAPEASVRYNAEASFSVGIIPNRAPPVHIGDELGFTLSASQTGYGNLYLLNASGGVLVLAENLLVTGGAQTSFPTPGSGFTFRASPPAGVERVLFLMTRQPFKGFGGGASGPVQLPVQAHDFIAELNTATGNLPDPGWVMAEIRVEIVPVGG